MFTAEVDTCQMPDFLSTSVIRVDAERLSQTELIQENKEWLTTIEWPEVERVRLEDKNRQRWWMNATTGEVIAVTE